MSDLISRQAAIDAIQQHREGVLGDYEYDEGVAFVYAAAHNHIIDVIKQLPSVPEWIPVTERLPEELKAVNITWVNHEPEPYYHDIKDRNFVATGIYFHGDWYWYSTVCEDYLREYGEWDVDLVDDAVEILAWMPLPEPYKGEK